MRSIVGHLVRAGVLRPSPSPIDRVKGRIEAPFDGRARATCRSSAADATRARWKQYRSVWAFVEDAACRREAVLRHFGDAEAPRATVACCDVCAPECIADVTAVQVHAGGASRAARAARRPSTPLPPDADLDGAILHVVAEAQPQVGRTRTVEILRGGRSKVIAQHGYDELPGYGTFGALRADEVLGRVDELIDEGRLASTGGRFPKLTVMTTQPLGSA